MFTNIKCKKSCRGYIKFDEINIPQSVYDQIASYIYPKILEFYKTKEGKELREQIKKEAHNTDELA